MGEFTLTVEEIALLFSLIGQPQAGQRLMAAHLGEITEAEARARLLAASHSLMARGLLTPGPEGPLLDSSLAQMVKGLSRLKFSIRYSRSTQEAEFALAYHFHQDAIVEHRLEQGVVHRLAEVPDASVIIKRGLLFFGLPQAQPFTAVPIRMASRSLLNLKDVENPAAVEASLRQTSAAEESLSLLAEDLARPQYRGSALRVQYDSQGNPYSAKGFLLLHGPQRLWLISLSGSKKETATLMPASVASFQQEVTTLLSNR